MLHKVIKYTDYDGNEQEMDAYFNLNKTECMDLDLEYEEEGGLLEHLKKVLLTRDGNEIRKKPAVDFIKLLVERSYGVRPENDRSSFIKEDDDGKPLYKKFKNTMAYDAFIFALLSGEESLDDFASAVLPNVPGTDVEAAKKKLEEDGFGALFAAEPSSTNGE